MRGLTFHRPWIGGAILAPSEFLPKRIENRKTKPPACIRGRRFALHAGKVVDQEAVGVIAQNFGLRLGPLEGFCAPVGWFAEGILATAICAGYIEQPGGGLYLIHHFQDGTGTEIDSGTKQLDLGFQGRWWRGPYAWLLDDVRALAEPIPFRGMQGLWPIPREIEARLL